MARITKPLTATEIKNAKPRDKKYKLFDGKGLILLVNPSGTKGWRYNYRFAGKENQISLGPYPTVSLADAREKHLLALKQLDSGINPSLAKKIKKQTQEEQQANTFEKLANEWYGKQNTLAETTKNLYRRRLDLDVIPKIGKIPVTDLSPSLILHGVLRPMEKRGVGEMTHRTKNLISRILRYGVACSYLERDLTTDLKGALSPFKTKHHPAITNPKEVGALLRAIDTYHGSFVVKSALQLTPYLFLRPGELRAAQWSEFDFDKNIWMIPGVRMKMDQDHLVPLASQALNILTKLKEATGSSKYLFPSPRSIARPISNNAINAALRNMGYTKEEVTAHGFRATARTILDEELTARIDFIEHQLSHAVKDANGRAYNRTTHLAGRTEMMQQWADYLDELKRSGEASTFQKAN
jgi:integrase